MHNLSVLNKTKKHLTATSGNTSNTVSMDTSGSKSPCYDACTDNVLGFILLNGSNQEVPRGNKLVSKAKHLTQVTVLIESSLPFL